ncbi:hypothetical protein LBW89_18365 [Paenibacillus sp. alder61]|uniref:Uncharacterized protein n=1 Tax=Paenibacillus faecis TaxID=862114 RepID=A0A5D0CNG1_9BACL|nr:MULTISPECIES: hypothetical protein [Paenibacillus]MCA1294980.1 hypothetical protein [Paenibacillus sp. alder61]TYA10754.1 hypothetical protein FRY98_23520 [Paenibacillus faecis]
MDYDLFLNTKLDVMSLGDLLSKMLSGILNEEIKCVKVRSELGYHYLYVNGKYFTIHIELDDEDREEYREMNARYHYVDTNIHISVQLLSKTFEIGWLKLLELIGRLLKAIAGDILLLDDCSFSVMKRKNSITLVNTNLDEYRIKYITRENLKKF